MVGRAVIESLKKRECIIQPLWHDDVDLLDSKQTSELFIDMKPDFCIHLAGYNGNIKFNSLHPADIYYKTTMMGLNVLKACQDSNIRKSVSVLSSCGYQASSEPLNEVDFLKGEPDESTEAHAYGKRDLLIYSKMIAKQSITDFKPVCCIYNTVYGPHDSFDLNKTKVVGSLIKKFVDAVETKSNVVELWGDGSPKREIIFSSDIGEGIVQTLEKYDDTLMPINLGFDKDHSIKQIAEQISELTGFDGAIRWDLERPNGQMRKILNSSRMKEFDINMNETPLKTGLEQTISWYKQNKGKIK